MRSEPGIAVTDNLAGQAEPLEHVVHIELGYSWPRDRGGAWQEYSCAGTTLVHYGKDSVLPLSGG